MRAQILLHVVCQTLWEPKDACQRPGNTRTACSQVAFVTSQD